MVVAKLTLNWFNKIFKKSHNEKKTKGKHYKYESIIYKHKNVFLKLLQLFKKSNVPTNSTFSK